LRMLCVEITTIIGCSLKIHRVKSARCWRKLHIRKGLVQTVPLWQT
jgi:hypothetical protein